MLEVQVASVSASAVNDYGWQLGCKTVDTSVRFIRGGKSKNFDALFDEWAAALQFPWYFGENMPAFVDCLGDLSWLANDIVIIVWDAELLLADEPEERPQFVKALVAADARLQGPSSAYPEGGNPRLIRFVCQIEVGQGLPLLEVFQAAGLITRFLVPEELSVGEQM